ncbi:MAG TPA: cyanophycin synthetase, partial [Rhodanobacteraceae bacterium]|nr:cyanophycin synthetase [Rhodanobacteraceae bacterium]
ALLGRRVSEICLLDRDPLLPLSPSAPSSPGVTTVDLDHQDWLGNDLDSIGREKAGIFRAGRPAIIGDATSPRGLLDAAETLGADVRMAARDFSFDVRAGEWRWRSGETEIELPQPALDASCQHANAAAAIAALYSLHDRLGWNTRAIERGVTNAHVAARLQRFASAPELIVDVAHNPQAARVLAAWLRAHPSDGRTLAVFGALGDKDVRGIVEPLRDVITDWQLAGLAHDSPRGFAADALRDLVRGTHADVNIAGTHDDVETALAAAFMRAARGDRVVAFGSFFVAAAALQFARARGAAG